MIKPQMIEGHGLMLPGHDTTPTRARADAQAYLLAHGATEFEAEARTERADVRLCWWGGESVGFVPDSHDGAAPVAMVQLS